MKKKPRSPATAIAAALLAVSIAPPARPHEFHYLNSGELEPARILPAPPTPGSMVERAELAALHRIVEGAGAERLARARWDDGHEDPGLFDAAVGARIEDMPLTWSLLRSVQEEGDAAADLAKARFDRRRPWSVDPTLANCDAGRKANPGRSYPSGHATLGYSTGFVLARLLPERAQAILARAADYAMSREVCGVHFPSDTEASHVLGTLVAVRLLADPAFSARFAAARAELAAAHVT